MIKFLFGLLASTAILTANPLPTLTQASEGRRLSAVIGIALYYAEKNNTTFPHDLRDIRNLADLPIILNEEPASGNFGDRHAFLSEKLSVPGFGTIYTLGIDPNYKYIGGPSKPGRLVGYVDTNDVPGAYWLPESEIQRLLALHPTVKLLPPMGEVPAPTISLKKDSPPTEHELRVLKAAGVKLKIDTTTGRPLDEPKEAAPPAPSPAPTLPAAPIAPPPAKSSNALWWIAGAITALAGLALLVRRKKNS